jgi:hypothetical protein
MKNPAVALALTFALVWQPAFAGVPKKNVTALDAAFDKSFAASFVKNCVGGKKTDPKRVAICRCTSEHLTEKYAPDQLTALSDRLAPQNLKDGFKKILGACIAHVEAGSPASLSPARPLASAQP